MLYRKISKLIAVKILYFNKRLVTELQYNYKPFLITQEMLTELILNHLFRF
jgi:hypothetical protein